MDFEKYFDVKNIKGNYQIAIAPETAKALTEFCQQEQEFKQAIEQSDKTFQECLDYAVKNVKQSCSDMEIYSRAVKFYFPTAEIHFHMSIDLIGKAKAEAEDSFSVLLDSLLDF